MNDMNVLDTFSGIGSFSLSFQRAGATIIAHSEIDTYRQEVLHRHFPGVPQLGRIENVTKKPFPQQLTLFVEEPPAKTLALPEIAKDWLEREADCSTSTFECLTNLSLSGWSGKTCPAHYLVTAGAISQSSSWNWSNAGIASHGECLTLNISEFHNDAEESLLSDILETDVPQKYYLSAKACKGILARARQRGKPLPAGLRRKLICQARRFSGK